MRKAITWVGAVVLLICVGFGGAFVIAGIILGLLATTGFAILMWRMPGFFRRLVHRFPLVADILFTSAAYAAFPGGLIGFIGAAATAVLVSMFIEVDMRIYKLPESPRRGKFGRLRQVARGSG
jgi:hypothetical protein